MQSKVSGHWTDDRLLGWLYGVEPEDAHFESCAACRERVAALKANRAAVEGVSQPDVSFEFLAAQRRNIYARVAEPHRLWSRAGLRRWASAAATLLILGGGVVLYENRPHPADNQLSDAQLAQQVSNMAQDAEPQSTAPLQALFEE